MRKQDYSYQSKIKVLEEIVQNLNLQIQDYTDQLNRHSHDRELNTDKSLDLQSENIQLKGQLDLNKVMNELKKVED